MYNGYEHWPTDIEKCTGMRVGNQKGSGCGTCVKVCPWNKPYTRVHRAVGWTVRHSGLARSVATWADDFLGYGKARPENKWWFDLEDVDGMLQIPTVKRKEENQVDRKDNI
jgi:ferredoxin